MKIQVKNTKYHRNGVSGEGFWCAHIIIDGKHLIATMSAVPDWPETEEEDYGLDPTQCRVINPMDPDDCYRGDQIGYELIDQGVFAQ